MNQSTQTMYQKFDVSEVLKYFFQKDIKKLFLKFATKTSTELISFNFLKYF